MLIMESSKQISQFLAENPVPVTGITVDSVFLTILALMGAAIIVFVAVVALAVAAMLLKKLGDM